VASPGSRRDRPIAGTGGLRGTDYLFAYAVEPPHHPEQWMRLVSNAGWLLRFGNWQGDATAFEPSYNVTGADGVSGNSCGNTDGFVHSYWPSTAPQPSDSASGAPINPYALGQTRTAICESTTGT